MSENFTGVRIDSGMAAFQIVQQDSRGFGEFSLAGRWKHSENRGTVQLRVVREDDGVAVVSWQDAKQDGQTWSHTISNVPAGGLYRIESRLCLDQGSAEWSPHGDLVHHLGVGDLWIIAGQSNAAGYGRGPVNDPPRLGVHVLRNDETWDIATHLLNETTRSTHPNMEGANPGHSPYLRFAKDLNDELGYPIGLIQTSLGGSGLGLWNTAENPNAYLYQNLLHCMKLAGGKARGMVWYQGESDSATEGAKTYERRFAEFITTLRRDLKNDTLPVIVAQLNRCTNLTSDHRGWSMVREAQRQAVKLGHVAVVSTIDLPISDLIHTSSDGNVTLGSRKAHAALEVAYGRPGRCKSPNVTTATLSADRKLIDLTFADVANRIRLLGPAEGDFVVEDSQGAVKITKADTPQRDKVRLELERATVGQTLVHGAYGAFPPSNVRDAEEAIPMLGFYGLEAREG